MPRTLVRERGAPYAAAGRLGDLADALPRQQTFVVMGPRVRGDDTEVGSTFPPQQKLQSPTSSSSPATPASAPADQNRYRRCRNRRSLRAAPDTPRPRPPG